MTVTLLSNIAHYHHLAGAFDKSGILRRYITVNSLFADELPPTWLPHYWQNKLEGRRLPDVPRDRVKQIWAPELLQRGIGLVSAERGNYLNNHLFDRLAMRWIEDCQVLHFVSS
ncbi:MAG: hypothetical protein ACREIC_10090, partial [Limisphaerales bacterium]